MSKLTVERVASTEDRTLPVFAEVDELMERIRNRAYEICRERGFAPGRDLDDWLAAEREICWPSAAFEEEDDEYEIKLALAGFDPEDITVTATPMEVIVRAVHESDEEDEAPTGRSWTEFRRNSVWRRFELPGPIEVDELEVEYENGLLEIEMPKVDAAHAVPHGGRKRVIPVTTAA